ncbi:hypothetical protein AX17_002453 [Amanita inopinata Kibby_2008]|nr:hypothetical protein AX17_002453 [Amanita inopinata Kibby_2008]
MTDNRRSTIYDFSSLRLHRDGTRVQQSDQLNLSQPRLKQNSVRDARGNWIANDAGGLWGVSRYRNRNVRIWPSARGSGEDDDNGYEDGYGVELGKRRKKEHDDRTSKRRNFVNDLDFLNDLYTSFSGPSTLVLPASQAGTTPRAEGEPCLPPPSSDLLKCIHYFAATFYTERGELSNLGLLYRKEKKRKGKKVERPRESRRNKRRRVGGGRRIEMDDDEYEDSSASDKEPQEPENDHGDDPYDSDDGSTRLARTTRASQSKSISTAASADGRGGQQSQKYQQDMYKVLDGSALMAIGMLVQEHVARLVRPEVPEGWEFVEDTESDEDEEDEQDECEDEDEGEEGEEGEEGGYEDEVEDEDDVESEDGFGDEDGDGDPEKVEREGNIEEGEDEVDQEDGGEDDQEDEDFQDENEEDEEDEYEEAM